MFEQAKRADVARGRFSDLFTNGPRLARYIKCLLIGVPLWFVVGILITLAPLAQRLFYRRRAGPGFERV